VGGRVVRVRRGCQPVGETRRYEVQAADQVWLPEVQL
jgi:hypothetical protein